MDRFQFSENYTGPWLELVKDGYKTPNHAMESARAAFPTWGTIYIAKMRRLDAGDLLASPEQFVGEAAERVSVKHGSAITEEVMVILRNNPDLISAIWDGVDRVLHKAHKYHKSIWVPGTVRGYKKGQPVRPGHFIEVPAGMLVVDEASDIPDEVWEAPLPKLKLKDLM